METANGKEGRYFEDIKYVKNKRKQVLAGHKQFSDKDFPTEIGIEAARDRQIHWKRILDLDENAQLFGDPNLSGTMELGLLSKRHKQHTPAILVKYLQVRHSNVLTWTTSTRDVPDNRNFVAAITAVWHHRKLFNYVFPPGQDFHSPEYCGLFYFRFWKMGKWVYVVVDDKLPIIGGKKVDKVDEPKKKTDRHKKTAGASEQTSQGSQLTEIKESQEDQDSPKEKPNGRDSTVESGDALKSPEKEEKNKPDRAVENDPAGGEDSTKGLGIGKEPKPARKENVSEGPQSGAPEGSKKNKPDSRLSSSDGTHHGVVDSKKRAPLKPIYLQVVGSKGDRFYWAPLFEKAYAKFCGGYHLMEKMGVVETILDITGGTIEVYYTNYLPKNFFLSLKHFSDNRSIVLATSNMKKRCRLPSTYNFWEEEEEKNEEEPYSYFALTQVVFADFQKLMGVDKMMGFVRLRNPCGALCWGDDWMEASQEWEILPSGVKKKLEMVSNEIGEFYLTYDNFLKAFSSLLVSTVSDSDNFNCEGYFGLWTRPRLKYNLCNIDELRFHEFPQHKIWVRDPNSDDSLFVEVIISLIQSGSCCCSESSSYIGIIFFLFCLESGRTYTPPLDSNFFRYNKPIGCSNYTTEKEITGRFSLPPGHYLVVVVPDHTNLVHPCLDNDYLLRVLTPSKFPKPPPPHMAVTFCESENLNIYFNYAEMIEPPQVAVAAGTKETSQTDSSRTNHKDKNNKGRKKKTKHN